MLDEPTTPDVLDPPPADEPSLVAMSEESADPPATTPLGVDAARPLLFAATQEWIPFLPKPGKYAHSVYGELDLSESKFQRILSNFNAGVYPQDLPINIEHDSRAAGAIGWIKPGGMRIASDGSIEVKPEWNATGRELIESDRFRYVSAEFANRWQNPTTRQWHEDVAIGLAICTRPHFKTDVLRPLALSEHAALSLAAQHDDAGDPGTEVHPMSEQEQTPTTPPAVTPEAPAAPVAPAAPTTPVTLMDVVISAEQRQQERAHVAQLTERVTLAERERDTARSELARERRERLEERAKAEVLGRSAENTMAWFGSVEENTRHLISLAENHGWESAEVKWAITQKRNEAHAIKASGVFDPIGAAGIGREGAGKVISQVNHLADQVVAAKPGTSREQAIAQVFAEHPDLYDQYVMSA